MTTRPLIHADHHGLKHEEITQKIIGAFYDLYNELGYGFLESVYDAGMAVVLAERGLFFERQIAMPVTFHGHSLGDFRPDFLVERCVIIELKAARAIEPAFEKQLLNYLKATQIEVGIILNFGPEPKFKRLVFDNERKEIRGDQRKSAAAK